MTVNQVIKSYALLPLFLMHFNNVALSENDFVLNLAMQEFFAHTQQYLPH